MIGNGGLVSSADASAGLPHLETFASMQLSVTPSGGLTDVLFRLQITSKPKLLRSALRVPNLDKWSASSKFDHSTSRNFSVIGEPSSGRVDWSTEQALSLGKATIP